MDSHTITQKRQVTIPKELRRRLGIQPGTPVVFEVNGDSLEIRIQGDQRPIQAATSGFGLVKVAKPAIPADFDPAELLIKQ